ncbi:MAG: hypothetical protein A2W99_06210 [Bacteroidetes bacterium GWF2_33_16]|nr:MAG: hypothetical protein A2X00_12685 [Bacteroidetes bacterium GWE2_32_14]OFY05274.1 MAG: hypothetical protein A2W99_06210 [Bacteroidetes bacterium GWF2_33_16]
MTHKSLQLKFAIILLGFIAFVTQVILLREFLTFFNGNELIIGIILATWMLLTGLGAYLGRFLKSYKKQNETILILLGSLAFIPILTVLELHFLSRIFFTPGIMLGLTDAFYYTLLVLSPFCIISGMLFTLFAKTESINNNQNKIGSIYALESIGSMAGGLILNIVLIWFLSTFQSLYVVMILVVAITAVLSIKNKSFLISGILVFIFMLFNFLYLTNNLDKSIRELSYPNQIIQHIDETPYGILVVTNQAGQVNFYENNVLMATSGDVALREESVHFAMIQHDNPQNVLVLSGIITGAIPEILKYPVKKIDYIDVNPGVIRLAKKYLDVKSSEVLNLIENDPIRYLKKASTLYDVVLINLPKPSTIQFNRFYTVEFFSLLKKRLTSNAVVCISMPSSSNYLNDEARKLLSVLAATLKTEFKNILILPGVEDFILASDYSLNGNITQVLEQKMIQNEYVNSFYFHDDLLQERSANLMSQLDSKVSINRDFNPVGYQSSIKLWLSYFKISYWIPALLIILFTGFFYFRASALNKSVFAAGFAGTSIELLLLLVFQVLYGYVYFAAGVFFMIFMGGLAIGSLHWQRVIKQASSRLPAYLLAIILGFTITLPLVFKLFRMVDFPEIAIVIIFVLLVLIISLLSGAIFSISTHLGKKEISIIASDAYGLDLLGSAAGALLLSVYLVPILGFELSLVGTAFVCLLSLLFIYKDHPKKR